MKIIKINVTVSTRFVGSAVRDQIDVYIGDDMTEKQIEDACENTAREWMHEQIEWDWDKIEEDDFEEIK